MCCGVKFLFFCAFGMAACVGDDEIFGIKSDGAGGAIKFRICLGKHWVKYIRFYRIEVMYGCVFLCRADVALVEFR